MKRNASGPSQRQLRVGELVRHSLSEIFARGTVNDPVLERTGVTVLEVRASPDLKVATAYVRPFANADADGMLEALKRNSRRIRGLLSPKLNLKFMPEVRFRIDTAPENADRIDALLRDPAVARDLFDADDANH